MTPVEYTVEGEAFGTRLHQARARARYLSNQFGRPIHVMLGEQLICTYNRGGELEFATAEDRPSNPPSDR